MANQNAAAAAEQNQNPDREETLEVPERLTMLETLVLRNHGGLEVAGMAINRCESFIFASVKLLLDKGVVTFEEIMAAQDELAETDNLYTYWGVPEPEGSTEHPEEVTS